MRARASIDARLGQTTTGTSIQAAISLFGPLDLPFATQAGPQLVQDSSTPVYAPGFDVLAATDGAHDSSASHACPSGRTHP